MGIKSRDWDEGYATAMVFLYDIFKSRSNALFARGFRKKDVRLILSVIDAAIFSRGRLAEVGPRNMDLVLHKDGTAEFTERNKQGDK